MLDRIRTDYGALLCVIEPIESENGTEYRMLPPESPEAQKAAAHYRLSKSAGSSIPSNEDISIHDNAIALFSFPTPEKLVEVCSLHTTHIYLYIYIYIYIDIYIDIYIYIYIYGERPPKNLPQIQQFRKS